MQELLGRIARLDPSASLGLRVIACFDELVVGNVNTRALLAAAASLTGCAAGFASEQPRRTLRVGPRGALLDGPPPPIDERFRTAASDGLTVWLERADAPEPNDAITLERLALAVRIRHGRGRRDLDNRRRLGVVVDRDTRPEDRRAAADELGLLDGRRYRVVLAPLFAVWKQRPPGPEDVVPTRYGPLHAIVLPEDHPPVVAAPCGLGAPAGIEALDHSFRTALVALRLCAPPDEPMVDSTAYGGLVDLMADSPDDGPQPDVDRMAEVAAYPWGLATVAALVGTQSLREAARHAGVHHSTLGTRVETVAGVLGFDPLEGFGRARLGVAYLGYRARRSRVFDLPAPNTREA